MALKTALIPVIRTVQGFQLTRAVTMKSSPIRLGRGGSPMLAAAVNIHQTVNKGIRSFKPRFRARVRV